MISPARNEGTRRARPARRRRAVTPLAAATCALALTSCVGPTGGPAESGRSSAARQSSSARPSADPSPAGHTAVASPSALPNLTPAQMAGQRVIYSYSGLNPPATLLNWIRHGEVGGVIFFGGNISSSAQIAGVIKELDSANASTSNPLHNFPLLLMTDQEGGLVRRLPGPPVLSEQQIGASAHPAVQAKAAGTAAGKNLAGVGMNVNLAPVIDVFRAPGDFDDQFGRSYSTDPKKVSYLGADFIKSQQATGVAATAKHFPGLGAATASQNTDAGPVTLNLTLHALRTVDELPYHAAIAAGVKLVMVSWAVYPALAKNTPAGLSSAIVGGELRGRLGFKGVTITDALEADALQAFGTTAQRSTLAARAGMDLILCSKQSASQGQQARNALAAALRSGALSSSVFNAALTRITALRSGLAS
ncbi:MAG TPA: glycoside hydrolase family 3 N-terminal domain-containing protein [Streptosporangiaceae bacterium]|nr:glycoside hydrolase family 3 N-terminal domain-containing protein [Streptosporangiaceae bacterium]